MKISIILFFTVYIFSLSLIMEPEKKQKVPFNPDMVSADPLEIQDSLIHLFYDDGIPEGGYYWNSAGQGSANRITPPVNYARLIDMSIYFTGIIYGDPVYKPIVLNMVDETPGEDYVSLLFKTVEVIPGWDITDLSGFNIFVDGDFFVGLVYDGDNAAGYGYDTEDNGRAWDFNGSEWTPFGETYFMRASIITVTTSVEIDTRIPEEFTISQNYPNPFNSSTQFQYSLPEGLEISIVVYDIRGLTVAELVNNYQAAGTYKITWNGKNNAGENAGSGVYFYRISAGEIKITRKLMLLQ
jgi:hypothetical protein